MSQQSMTRPNVREERFVVGGDTTLATTRNSPGASVHTNSLRFQFLDERTMTWVWSLTGVGRAAPLRAKYIVCMEWYPITPHRSPCPGKWENMRRLYASTV